MFKDNEEILDERNDTININNEQIKSIKSGIYRDETQILPINDEILN